MNALKKQSKIERKIKKELRRRRHLIRIFAQELEIMSQWPQERLLEARNRQYDILSELANIGLNWYFYMKNEDALDLYLYSECNKKCAPYLNEELLWENVSTEEMKEYSYPSDNVKVINEMNGMTKNGHFARISADYFIKKSLIKWSNILQMVLTIR